MLVLALNTTRWYRHVNGEVSLAQVERVVRLLEQAPAAQWRMVMVHQPVAVKPPRDRSNLLRGHEAALRRWAAAGADMIVGGHIHLPFIVALRERVPQLPRDVWAVQAGTAVSRRVRPQTSNSVNVFRIGTSFLPQPAPATPTGRYCQVERWDYEAATGRFERIYTRRMGGGTAK